MICSPNNASHLWVVVSKGLFRISLCVPFEMYFLCTDPVVGQDLIPMLLEEFPFLYLSTETLHRLWQQSSRQVEQLCKADQEIRRKKSLAQCQVAISAILRNGVVA